MLSRFGVAGGVPTDTGRRGNKGSLFQSWTSLIDFINCSIDFINITGYYLAVADWQALTKLTGGRPIQVERVRLLDDDLAIEGRFDLPALAQLSVEDQTFVAAFVRCHGSIKQMEKFFGVSYPTIKNRLNRIGARLPFVEIEQDGERTRESASALLDRLEKGEMSAGEVIDRLKGAPREEKK